MEAEIFLPHLQVLATVPILSTFNPFPLEILKQKKKILVFFFQWCGSTGWTQYKYRPELQIWRLSQSAARLYPSGTHRAEWLRETSI